MYFRPVDGAYFAQNFNSETYLNSCGVVEHYKRFQLMKAESDNEKKIYH